MKQHTLRIKGHVLVANEYNPKVQSPPFIFLHGITGSVNFWEHEHEPLLRDKIHWYALSLPGHYPAVFPDDMATADVNAENFTDLLIEAIGALVGDEPVVLIGHSTGGFFAVSIASRAPERVQAVLSISGFTHGRWIGILGMYQQMVRFGMPGAALFKLLYWSVKISKRYLGFIFALLYAHNFGDLYRNGAYAQILEASHKDYWLLELDSMIPYFQQMPHQDITPSLTRISAPLSVIVGTKDPIVPPQQSVHMTKSVADCHMAIIPDVGHLPMWEQPDQYKTHFQAWLERTTHTLATTGNDKVRS